jgi:uncharacterized protein (TIGR03503 family)
MMKTTYLIVLLLCVSVFSNGTMGAAPKIEMLKRQGHENEIPLLENRFRIDGQVDEITLIFFRKMGAPAVILVRPDGSKYFATEAVRNPELQWYDEPSYDLVTITNPMAGPWQVIGSILPNSRIVVLGDIELKAQSLPPLLFRGETVKLTGQVLNDGEPVKSNLFQEVVTLEVDFVSANAHGDANFGASTQEVAKFKDNGLGFDERAKDGIFTGEFKLDLPAGTWTPELYIATPLLQRRVVQGPVTLLDMPFKFDIALAPEITDEHMLTITLDEHVLKPETVVMQGRIFYPNNEEQAFVIDAKSGLTRQLAIKNYDWGRYSVEISAFGSNKNAREFMAELPVYRFEIERPIEVIPEIVAPKITEAELLEIKIAKEEAQARSTMLTISLIIGGNLLILLIGWLAIRKFVQKKSIMPKINLPFMRKKPTDDIEPLEPEKNQQADKGSKNDKSGEILNLSMSDD